MTTKQMKQVKEQLPPKTRIMQAFKPYVGNIRVIVRLPGEKTDTIYTVTFDRETDYPYIEPLAKEEQTCA